MQSVAKTLITITFFVLCVVQLHALKCNFEVSGDAKAVAANTHECNKDEKYCISFGGSVQSQIKNISVEVRSCESDVKDYLSNVEKLVGKPIVFSCAESQSEKDKKIGPFTFWYNCCQGDLCNNASVGVVMSPILMLAALLVTRYTSCF